MAKSSTLNVTQNIKTPGVSLQNADGTTAKTLYTSGANDSVVKSLMISSDDSAVQNVQVIVNDGTIDRVIGTVNVPASAGTNGTVAAVDALAAAMLPGLPVDQNGKRVLPLQATFVLKLKSLVAVTAAKTVAGVAVVEEY